MGKLKRVLLGQTPSPITLVEQPEIGEVIKVFRDLREVVEIGQRQGHARIAVSCEPGIDERRALEIGMDCSDGLEIRGIGVKLQQQFMGARGAAKGSCGAPSPA